MPEPDSDEWDVAGADGVPSVRIMRELVSVNGRPAGPEDDNACPVPEAEGNDPRSVLLPARQPEFDFRLRDVDIVDGRPVARLSFTPIDAQPRGRVGLQCCARRSSDGRAVRSTASSRIVRRLA